MSSQPQKKPAFQNYDMDNFLEAFRDLGKSTVSEAKSHIKQVLTTDIAENFGFDIKGGDLKPNESLDLKQLNRAKKEGFDEANKSFEAQLAAMRREGEMRMQKEQVTVRNQIQSIQQEIKSMAKSMAGFSREVEIATMQTSVNPGVYQRNFFMHLRTVIVSLRQSAESSKNWLAAHNQRSGKRGYFWNQVNKSGTAFMLSGERYAVMSTG